MNEGESGSRGSGRIGKQYRHLAQQYESRFPTYVFHSINRPPSRIPMDRRLPRGTKADATRL